MKSLTDDDEMVVSSEDKKDSTSTQPAWMRAVYENVNQWRNMLPEKVTPISRTPDSVKNPLFRVFERENHIAKKLLGAVRQDLDDVRLVCEGSLKQTNHLRMLLSCLTKGQSLVINES